MRLFVAADIDDDTRQQLVSIRQQFEHTLATARKAPRITWVDPNNAHVTLRFIGEVSEPVAGRVREAMEQPVGMPPFDVRWTTAGAFPGGRQPRVLWIGATEGDGELADLAATVEGRLDPVLGPGDRRRFRPHVTIGRVRDAGAGIDWSAALASAIEPATTTTVDHVTLYESRLSPKGPTYHRVYTWML